jgi:hypothetical protein
MELKAVIGIALAAFIIGGFIWLQIKKRNKK